MRKDGESKGSRRKNDIEVGGDEGRGEESKNRMYIKNTWLQAVAASYSFAGMKNSLVAPALIAIFVRGILAKFSHLQQDRGRTTLFDVYKPFLSSAVFHLKKTSLSECCE